MVGIVGPCSTADPNTFPLNKPIMVLSNDTVTLKKLFSPITGQTDGYIVDAINGINAQLANNQITAEMVIVRTEYGDNADSILKLEQTIANIMGNSVARTGVWALMLAPNSLYCTPRLIMVPGYTGLMANSLDTLVSNIPGKGYIPNASYAVNFAFGIGELNAAQAVLPSAHAVADANGEIDDAQLFIDTYGAFMTVAPVATLPVHDGPTPVAVAASGSILFSQKPAIGSTITLNGTVVTFVASGATALQVNLGVDLDTTLTALVSMLNLSADVEISKLTYSRSNLQLLMVDDTAGVAGNAFTLATNVGGTSLSSTHLTGGAGAVTPQDGTLTATLALGANPVVAALSGGLLDGLMAHAVVESAGTSMIADENWRNTINSRRIIPTSGGCKIFDSGGNIVIMPIAPRVIGQIIRRDFETGFPFHSAANQPISGIIVPARTIDFSLIDGATEGQLLLAANIGILARGNVGVETAISSGGFNYIGTDTCSDDPLWAFYNVTRGRDFIELSLMPALRVYLGRENIDRQTVANIIGTIEAFLGQLKAMQQILGYSVTFQGALNSAAEIRLGHLVVSFAAEEPPVLRRITTMSARYKPAIDAMVAQLAAQFNFTSTA